MHMDNSTNKIKLYYADIPNMGDRLNKLIVEELFHCKVVRHTYLTGEVSGIGSGLGQFTLHGNAVMRVCEKIMGYLFPNVSIWGSGFYYYSKVDEPFYRKNIRFCAVRGELSRKRVIKLLGHNEDILTADAGILAPCLIKEPIIKKYDIGIIPHMNEMRYEKDYFVRLAGEYPNSILINVEDDCMTVIKQISQCKAVLSSSLHGLIVADGFHIPNRHIYVTDRLGGDGFKFDDYYSAYGMEHEFTNLNTQKIPSLEEIMQWYKVPEVLVEEKKKALIECFPKKEQIS